MHFVIFMFFALTTVTCSEAFVYSLDFTVSGSRLPVGANGATKNPFLGVELVTSSGKSQLGFTSPQQTDSPDWPNKYSISYADGVNGVQQLFFTIYNKVPGFTHYKGSVTVDISTLVANNGYSPSSSFTTTSVTLTHVDSNWNGYPGDLYISHRITELRARRCDEDGNGTCGAGSASRNHIFPPCNLLVIPSLSYFLQI